MQTVFPPSDLYNWVSRIYEPGSRLLLTEYIFPVDFGAIAAGGRSIQNVQMTQNADFVLTSIEALPEWGVSVVEDIQLLIVDTSTGENFSNQRVPLSAIASTNVTNRNRPLPYPRWFSGISAVTLDVSSISVQNYLRMSLHGFQIRRLG